MSARPRGSSVIRCCDCPRRFVVTRRGGCRRCPDCRVRRRLATQAERNEKAHAERQSVPTSPPETVTINHAGAVQIFNQWQRNSF
jgi:hypothetical protein